jgi:hypothetical protein
MGGRMEGWKIRRVDGWRSGWVEVIVMISNN